MTTEQELNEFLAEEIMEFEMEDYGGNSYFNNWNPFTNLEQAFDCLETYCPDDQWWKLKVRSDGRYSLHFHIQETGWGAGWHDADTKPKAILGAIVKAENRFDEFKAVLDNDKN